MKCCNSCAYLKCNEGKPNPRPEELNNAHDNCEWYSQKNLDEKWEATKDTGLFLTCHSTDPTYYAKDKKHFTTCVGFTWCVFMHIKIFELLGCKWQAYRNAVGHKVAMTRRGMGEAAISMAMKSATLTGSLKIPTSFEEKRPLRYPTGFEKTVQTFERLIKEHA